MRTVDPDSPLFLLDGPNCSGTGGSQLPTPAWPPPSSSSSATFASSCPFRLRPTMCCSRPATHTTARSLPSSAALRMYRRPLPVANVAFLSTILWDGRQEGGGSLRENLELQASSAAQIDAGVLEPLAQATRQRIVEFTTHLFSAPTRVGTLELAEHGGHGGAEFIRDHIRARLLLGCRQICLRRALVAGIRHLPRVGTRRPRGQGPTRLAESIGRGEVLFN